MTTSLSTLLTLYTISSNVSFNFKDAGLESNTKMRQKNMQSSSSKSMKVISTRSGILLVNVFAGNPIFKKDLFTSRHNNKITENLSTKL